MTQEISEQKKNILFVCTGNTCRSPMAAVLFNTQAELEEGERWFASSAGLAAETGAGVSKEAVDLLKERKISLSDHKARQLSKDLVKQANLVLAMSETQRDLMRLYIPEAKDKIFTLHEYLGEEGELADPFGCGLEAYEKTLAQLDRLIPQLFKKLNKEFPD